MWETDSLEGHWISCMASAGGGGRVTRLGGATVLTNPASSITMLNCMLLKNVRPEGLEPLLDIGRVVLAAHERPPALFLSPLSGDLPGLEARLESLGWRRVLRQAVLVRRLDHTLPEAPAITVSQTEDREGWGYLLTEAYEVPGPLGAGIRSAWAGLTGDASYYLASLEERPVGTGLTWRQGPVAGLYAGAVLPAYRRRGVERATLIRRMQEARTEGAAVVTLQTEVGSPVEHLCRNRLGFDHAYERTLWTPGMTGSPLFRA